MESRSRFRWVQAALGTRPCDLVLRNATFLDVFRCQWIQSDIGIVDGRIVAIDSDLRGLRETQLAGKYVVPGFIDAHVHIESSMMTPYTFQKTVLPKGTTTVICDPHELANVQGHQGIQYFVDASERLALDMRVMLSSCVPATDFETNAGPLTAQDLRAFRGHPKVLGLAEVMNVPGVLSGNAQVWEKLAEFEGQIIDGHAPLLRGLALSAYVCAGISSCHESTGLEEAQEKLTKGMAVWIREGSVTKDLQALAPLLTMASSPAIGFCTDDRNPLDIANEGHIDYLVRRAIQMGIPQEAVYRSASWSVARHYGLRDRGAVAPGHRADLVVLGDPTSCEIEKVLVSGEWVDELAFASPSKASSINSVRARPPAAEDLVGPSGRVNIIGVQMGKVITSRLVADHDAPGVARLSVLERYGKGSAPANAYVCGFGAGLNGAIASSVGHDSHNLIAVGSNTEDMAVAMASLIECGGGYCVARGGAVQARVELPVGGLMSEEEAPVMRRQLEALRRASRAIGCELPEPFLQLAFMSLPVIPSLKLTDRGLVDVDAFRMIDVRAV